MNRPCMFFNGCAEADECPLERAAREDSPKQPFEIHITVVGQDPTYFRKICGAIGVKPVVLENLLRGEVICDMVTSSLHRGDTESAKCEMKRIARALRFNGFSVVREKIETVPWHAGIGEYFETHIAVSCKESDIERLEDISKSGGAHLSRNVDKRLDDGRVVVMVTIRKHDYSREAFDGYARELADALVFNAFEAEKIATEYAIYDSNVAHDNRWMEVA